MSIIYQKVPNKIIFFAMIVGGIPFSIFSFYGQELRGFIAFLSACSIICIIYILKKLWSDKIFWVGVILVLLVHSIIIFSIRWKESHFPGILLLPFVVFDMFISGKFLIFISRKYQS